MNIIKFIKCTSLFLLSLLIFACPIIPIPIITSSSSKGNNVSTAGNYSSSSTPAQYQADSYEVDNTKAGAKSISSGSSQNHTIHVRTDIDYVKLTVSSGKTYSISITSIDGFYPEVSLYHQNDSTAFFSISPFQDNWSETIVYKSTISETLYVSIKSKYQADLYGSYTLGYTFVDTPIAAPTNISATDGTYDSKIVVTWTASADAGSYEVYRATDGVTFVKLGETTSTTYEDTSSTSNVLTTKLNYTYSVRTVSGSKTSNFSTTDTGYISDFGLITDLAADTSTGYIALTWTLISDSSVSYDIYRSIGNTTDFTLIATDSSPYTVGGTQPDTTYYFKVIPKKTGITGQDSNIVNATLTFDKYRPDAPTASDNQIGKINITWTQITTATSYKLYRSADVAGTFTQIGTDFASDILAYTDTGVTANTYYYYKIQAVKSGISSQLSLSDSGIATQF